MGEEKTRSNHKLRFYNVSGNLLKTFDDLLPAWEIHAEFYDSKTKKELMPSVRGVWYSPLPTLEKEIVSFLFHQ